MSKTHYEVLGVSPSANATEIRSAYRKLVLLHHPDRSKDPASKPIFLAVTEAYEVLTRADERRRYDEGIADQERRQRAATASQAAAQRAAQTSPRQAAGEKPKAEPPKAKTSVHEHSIAEEIQRLTKLYQSGRHSEAEQKARAILLRDPRQGMPYAILGDLNRSRGNINEAAKMYAFAMQMDPKNAVYERRYNEVLNRSQVVSDSRRTRLEPEDRRVLVPMVGGAIVLASAACLAIGHERSEFHFIPLIASWTFGALICLFLSGVTVGVSLSIGNLVDRYGEVATTATGRLSPVMALGCVSLVQFWFAAGLYGAAGLSQRAWNVSTTRLIIGVAGATAIMSLGACLNIVVNPMQILTWGGNVIYAGALCGWILADAFR